MTAMNLIVQPAANAAFLLTDTARYDQRGMVSAFASKVIEMHGRGFFAAMATTGMVGQHHFRRRLSLLRAASLEELLCAIPGVFRLVESDLIGEGKPEACGSAHLSAVVAAFDKHAGSAVGYAISNDNSLFPAGAYRPYTLHPVRKSLTRFAGHPFPPGSDLCNPRDWNPETGALPLIEAQRADLFGLEGGTFRGVGGHAVLTTVQAAGVSQRILRAWPDLPGERINPARQRRGGWRILTALRESLPPRLPRIEIAA